MTHIAIDPGKSGGIAWRDYDGNTHCQGMPETERDFTDLISEIAFAGVGTTGATTAFVEEVGGYVGGVGQPGSAMFKFGRNFGYVLGTFAAMDIPVALIKPQAWMRKLGLGTKDGRTTTAWKNHLKAAAQRRHPDLKITLKTADALLILAAGPHFI